MTWVTAPAGQVCSIARMAVFTVAYVGNPRVTLTLCSLQRQCIAGRAVEVLLRPQPWPTSRNVVLPLTEDVVLPPWRLNRSSASSRVMHSKFPVTTSVLLVMQSGCPVGISCTVGVRNQTSATGRATKARSCQVIWLDTASREQFEQVP